MARNRKYQSAALRFGPALKAFLFCLLIGGSGVGYVWQKGQLSDLGKQVLKREARLNELIEKNEQLGKQLGFLRGPHYLEQRIKELNLGLAQPQLSQVWRLPEPARDNPRPARDAQAAVPRNHPPDIAMKP